MNEGIIAICSVLGTAGLVWAGWFLKRWFEAKIKADVEHTYNEKLESFKQRLSVETTTAIETVKAQLEIQNNERQFRYSIYYKEVSDTVCKLHNALKSANLSILEYMASDFEGGREARQTAALNQLGALSDAILDATIYLNDDCMQLLKDLQSLIEECFAVVFTHPPDATKQLNYEQIKKRNDERAELTKDNRAAYIVKYDALQRHFRKLLRYDEIVS